MSLVEQYRMRPHIVKRLTMVWLQLAVLNAVYSLITKVAFGKTHWIVIYLLGLGLPTVLSWGHFNKSKAAWGTGLVYSGGLVIAALFALKDNLQFALKIAFHTVHVLRADAIFLLTITDTLLALCLMGLAFFLALSLDAKSTYAAKLTSHKNEHPHS